MAIFVTGKSVCGLCHSVIETQSTLAMFPPFVVNRKDPLSIFNDGCFHRECVFKHPLAQMAEKVAQATIQSRKPANRQCSVCKVEITDPDNYLACGFLTSDQQDPLSELNFAHFHRSCLRRYPDLLNLSRLLGQRLESTEWEGPGLTILLQIWREALSTEG